MDLLISINWRDEEADGSLCALCGDAIFLRAWHPVVSAQFSGTPSESAGTAIYCTGCKEALESGPESDSDQCLPA